MIADGKAIARLLSEQIARAIRMFPEKLALDIVVVGENPIIEGFIRTKKRIANELGVSLVEHRFPETITEESLLFEVKKIAIRDEVLGLIIQLPLPEEIRTQEILNAVPIEKDVDMLSSGSIAAFARGDAPIIPPVAGAIMEILDSAAISVAGKEVLVLGHGRLVGIPASILMRHNGAHVTIIDQEISDLKEHVRESAIIICGVGKPSLITPDMLTFGTVLIDAGTSEAGKKVVGDADPDCAKVTSLFTPVPGGVGPVAIMMIFKNLYMLAQKKTNTSPG